MIQFFEFTDVIHSNYGFGQLIAFRSPRLSPSLPPPPPTRKPKPTPEPKPAPTPNRLLPLRHGPVHPRPLPVDRRPRTPDDTLGGGIGVITTRTTSSHPFPPLRALHRSTPLRARVRVRARGGSGRGLGFGPGSVSGSGSLGLGSHGFHSWPHPTHHPNPNQVNTSIMGNWFPKNGPRESQLAKARNSARPHPHPSPLTSHPSPLTPHAHPPQASLPHPLTPHPHPSPAHPLTLTLDLDPRPSTLTHQPLNLSTPQPATRNPQPATRNPQPSTVTPLPGAWSHLRPVDLPPVHW